MLPSGSAERESVKDGPCADPAWTRVKDEVFYAFANKTRRARKLSCHEEVRDVGPVSPEPMI